MHACRSTLEDPTGGPLLLVQNESCWTCGDVQQGHAYLGELNRYFREAGLEVPTINANNLWQGVEGEIDCWTGSGDLLATVRQLATVRPDQPRLISEFGVGEPSRWGRPAPAPPTPEELEQQLALILAAGGQFNLSPFHGGTTPGFWGGRLPEEDDGFVTTSFDHGAPLSEAGVPAPAMGAVRRICTFASRFARVLANLEPGYRPVALSPGRTEPQQGRPGKDEAPLGPTVVHASGTQGGVAFIFNPRPKQERGSGRQIVELLLPEGTTLPVDITGQAVTWTVFDAFAGGRAKLDYSNLSALAMIGRVVVLFGPVGAAGQVSVNGAPLQTTVPEPARPPTIVEHENVTFVVCSREHLETIQLRDDAVFIGAVDLTPSGQPIGTGAKHCTRVNAEGQVSQVPLSTPPHPRRSSERPALSEWTSAPTTDYCDGTSPRFASIDGPADLAALGSVFGYGWYRLRLKSSAGGRVRAAFPFAGDRLHVHLDGEGVGVAGLGPGASPDLSLTLKKGMQTLVVLTENLGRLSGGNNLGESKGLFGPVYDVKPLRVARPVLKTGEPFPILTFRTPVWGVSAGDLTLPARITWTLAHRRKTPVILTLGPLPARALLMLNGKPAAVLERRTTERHVLQPDQLKSGMNLVQVALFPDAPDGPRQVLQALAGSAMFEECVEDLTARAEWAFAKWEPPRANAFHRPKGASRGGLGCPAWWGATFQGADASRPLFFDATGLTKGQLYLNGRHVGRYFAATPDGKPVPPQPLYLLPGPWVHAGSENQVLIFDEHGASPARTRLVYDAPRGTSG